MGQLELGNTFLIGKKKNNNNNKINPYMHIYLFLSLLIIFPVNGLLFFSIV